MDRRKDKDMREWVDGNNYIARLQAKVIVRRDGKIRYVPKNIKNGQVD